METSPDPSADVVSAFDGRTGVGDGPLTADEVAAELDWTAADARHHLDAAVDGGRLRTRTVADGPSIWWRPAGGRGSDADDGATTPDAVQRAGGTEHPALELEFHSTALATPFLTIGEGDVSVTIDTAVPLADGSHVHYYTATGLPVRKYLDVVERTPSVTSARLLSTAGDTIRVEARSETDSMASTFAAFGGRTSDVTLVDDHFRIVAKFPDAVDRDAVLAAVRSIYPDVELVATRRILTAPAFRSMMHEELTERQRTALRIAYFGGYFSDPRTSTGEELAAVMDITKQTFHHHLRHAQEGVFRRLFAESDHGPRSDWSD